MRYVKEVFDVMTFDQAKNVVLTASSECPDKFEKETQFLIDAIKHERLIHENDTVLDFGCGMGRVSKELVHQLGANVIGLDISDSMLTFAKLYVAKPSKFNTKTSYDLANSVDSVISTFVLQHTENPSNEITNIAQVLKPNGYFIMINEDIRYVPSDVDKNGYVVWNDDKFDVFDEVEKHLTKIKSIPYINTHLTINIYKKS